MKIKFDDENVLIFNENIWIVIAFNEGVFI